MSDEQAWVDAADVTWAPADWTTVAVYRTDLVRDWRWLWLRRKERTTLVGYEFDPHPPSATGVFFRNCRAIDSERLDQERPPSSGADDHERSGK